MKRWFPVFLTSSLRGISNIGGGQYRSRGVEREGRMSERWHSPAWLRNSPERIRCCLADISSRLHEYITGELSLLTVKADDVWRQYVHWASVDGLVQDCPYICMLSASYFRHGEVAQERARLSGRRMFFLYLESGTSWKHEEYKRLQLKSCVQSYLREFLSSGLYLLIWGGAISTVNEVFSSRVSRKCVYR